MDRKIVLVTGATGNLGKAVIKKLLASGYKVLGTVTHDDKKVNGNSFEKFAVDLSIESETQTFVSTVIERYKRIDAAILTVGGFSMGDIEHTSLSDIQKQHTLNFETAYNVARAVFLQMMKQEYGRIFMIGSKPGIDIRNAKGMVAYSLAKSLIFRLAELMNIEAKGTNVVTSVIVPSTIDTPENRRSMPDSDFKNWVKADQIADVISFYCSEEAMAIREPVIKIYQNS